jgi:hypothetical protein
MQTTEIRIAPKAIACWRNSLQTLAAIPASRSTAAAPATAGDDPEVARGVIPGTDIDTPGGSWWLRKLEARNYQFFKVFLHWKRTLPTEPALNFNDL